MLDPGQSLAGESEQLRSVNPHEVLTELYALLEEYAPSWYAEKQCDRAMAAGRPAAEVLLELVALLEDYFPCWYPEKARPGFCGTASPWSSATPDKFECISRIPGQMKFRPARGSRAAI